MARKQPMVICCFKIEEADLNVLKKVAARHKRTVGNYLRILIEDNLAKERRFLPKPPPPPPPPPPEDDPMRAAADALLEIL
jgi:hypothetical protein